MEQHFTEIVSLLICVAIGATMIGWEARKAFTGWQDKRKPQPERPKFRARMWVG